MIPSTPTRAALLALFVLPPFALRQESPAPRPEDPSGFSGRWLGYKPTPARIELDRFVLELRVAGGEIGGHLELPELTVPLEGAIEEGGELARFSASAQGKTASFELTRDGARLVGSLDQWGLVSEMFAVRATPELEAVPPYSELTEVEVEFPIELPERVSRRGLEGSVEAQVRASILSHMERDRVVGLSAAVVRGGEVVDVRSFGWEDFHREVPASERTRYRWASVTKPLTALAALVLFEEGRLDLEGDVRELVPEWPDRGVVVTPRALLTHQSGIAHDDDTRPRTLRSYAAEHPFADTITALDMFSESEPLFAPGEGFQYSTPGYVLLGAVIERAAGVPYARFVRERICEPLGMTTMRPDRVWETVEHRAAGYGEMSRDRGVFLQNEDDISWKTPAGGWISTVEDLARFAAGLMGPDLVSAATQEAMWTPAATAAGAPTSFGLGVVVQRLEGRLSVSHSGSQLLTSTHFACLPEEQLAVALMCNKEGVVLTGLAAEILRACL